jgi:hypothetical protein
MRTLFRILCVLAVASVWPGGTASAGPIINFIELPNEAGIHLTGFDAFGNPIDVTKLGAEAFHLAATGIAGVDAVVKQIGTRRTETEFLINILESVGGPISDQVWVHHFPFMSIDFFSDPSEFVTDVEPFATFVETGALQNVLNYENDRFLRLGDSNGIVSINVLSDVEVPEPATLALVASGLLSLAIMRRRNRAASPHALAWSDSVISFKSLQMGECVLVSS